MAVGSGTRTPASSLRSLPPSNMSRPAVLLLSALLLLATQGARGAAIKLGVWASDVPNARLYEEENGTYTGSSQRRLPALRRRVLRRRCPPPPPRDRRKALTPPHLVPPRGLALPFQAMRRC